MKKTTLIVLVFLITLSGCGSDSDPYEVVIFTDVDCPSTAKGRITSDLNEYTFNSLDELESFYSQSAESPDIELSSDFFDQFQLVTIEWGRPLSPSHRVDIISVRDTGDSILVNAQLEEPNITCPQDGVVRTPYCIIAIPKISKPITFNYTTIEKCNPPLD